MLPATGTFLSSSCVLPCHMLFDNHRMLLLCFFVGYSLHALPHYVTTRSIPEADQFFRFLTALYNVFSVIVNSCTFLTLCLIFFANVFIHFCCGVLVLSSQIPVQNSSNFSILGTFPLNCLVPCVFLQNIPWSS